MSIISIYTEKSGKMFAKQVIESYMKKNKMASVEEFLKLNPTIHEFEQNTKLLGIIRTHGYFVMNNQEYLEIIDLIRQEELKRKKLNTEDIQTITVNGKELATYSDKETGEQVTIDNTVSNRSIENEMKDIQKEHKQFAQMGENNTLNLMHYMEDNIKVTPDTQHGDDINVDAINEDVKQIALAAIAFEKQIGHPVDIDLNSKIIYDNGMIYSIEKRGDTYQVIAQGIGKAKTEDSSKVKQLTKITESLPKAS